MEAVASLEDLMGYRSTQVGLLIELSGVNLRVRHKKISHNYLIIS